ISNKYQKMYILIYTCLNIRAVYLDLLPDMSTLSFLMSFQRFSNIYGIPNSLYSDNAKSFVAAGDLLGQAMESEMFKEHLNKLNIRHCKIPVYSAWVGSTWERMIRVVKNCLYKTVGRAKQSYFEFLTILTNIANTINQRPLTYRDSSNDLEVITPNSFIKPF